MLIFFRCVLSQGSSRPLCVVLGETVGACEPDDSKIVTECDGYLISATEGQTCAPNVSLLQSYPISLVDYMLYHIVLWGSGHHR